MLIRKAFKFRLAPSKSQQALMAQGTGCARLVWNKALAIQNDCLAQKAKLHSYNDLAGFLKGWKKVEELGFLKEAPSQPLQR